MLSGEQPFGGDSEREIVDRVINGRHEALERLCADVPEELAAVVYRAMAPAPADRYAAAGEMKRELARLREQLRDGRAGPSPT